MAIGLCAIGLCLTALALSQRPESVDDFRSFYRGAQLVGTHQGVYSQPAWLPDTNRPGRFLPYIRLPFYALLLKPLTALPYTTARAIWIALVVLAFAAMVPLYNGPRRKLAIALCFSMPVVFAINLAQDVAFIVLIVLAAGRLVSSQREFAGGLMVSLLGIKPTFLLPAGLVLLARSRRGTCGLVLGTAIQVAVSFVLEGPGWPLRYLELLRNPMFDLEPRRMLNLRAITTSLSLPAPVFVIGAIALLAWLWVIARKMELSRALLLALPVAMLASPHSYIYDAVVAIPLLVQAASTERISGLLAILALTPVPYIALLSESAPLVLAGCAVVVVGAAVAVPLVARPLAC